jgi:hypothetical protein
MAGFMAYAEATTIGAFGMQVSVEATTEMIIAILADAAKLDVRAAQLEAGTIFPGPSRASSMPNAPMVDYVDLSEYKKPSVLASAIWLEKRRAEHGRACAASHAAWASRA